MQPFFHNCYIGLSMRAHLWALIRCLANYEAANKNLEKARAKNKDIVLAENAQQEALKQFERISERAKEELKSLKVSCLMPFVWCR